MQPSFVELLGSVRNEHERVVDELQMEIEAMRTLLHIRGIAWHERQPCSALSVTEQGASDPSKERSKAGLQEELPSTIHPGEQAPFSQSSKAGDLTAECKTEREFVIRDKSAAQSDEEPCNNPSSEAQSIVEKQGEVPYRSSTTSTLKSLVRDMTLFMSLNKKHLSHQHAKEKSIKSLPWHKRVGHFLESPSFEGFIGLLIVSNTLVMTVESQYLGYKAGFKVGYPGMSVPVEEIWGSHAESAFNSIERTFTTIFAIELFLRISFLRLHCFMNPVYWIDAVVVGVALADWTMGSSSFNPAFARLLRLVKLGRGLRVVRVAKVIMGNTSVLESLHLLLKCISSSVGTLFWAFSILGIFQCIAAMLFSQMVRNYVEDPTENLQKRQEVFSYYGTFSRSLLTMFEIMLANWAQACRVLVNNVSEFFTVAFLVYRCCLGYAVLNVISAVFIQQTLRVAQNDKDIMIMQRKRAQEDYARKLRALFSYVDSSGDGRVSWDEFNILIDDPHLKTWMSALELDPHDLEGLFRLIGTGAGEIAVDEFVHGASLLKGSARAIDMAHVLAKVKRIEQKIDSLCENADGLHI